MTDLTDAHEFLTGKALRRWVRLESITWGVQQFGHENDFINQSEVVGLALDRLLIHVPTCPEEQEAALLLSYELSRLPHLFQGSSDLGREIAANVWAFAGLTELRSVWASLVRPWDHVAVILEALENPSGYSGLIYYEPVSFFARAPGLAGLLQRLDSALERDAELFGNKGETFP